MGIADCCMLILGTRMQGNGMGQVGEVVFSAPALVRARLTLGTLCLSLLMSTEKKYNSSNEVYGLTNLVFGPYLEYNAQRQ
jgi:hypothetical protein